MEWDELGRVAVIDVETTGVDPKSDRVISVAIFQTQFDPQGDELRGDTMTTVVNPGVPIIGVRNFCGFLLPEARRPMPQLADLMGLFKTGPNGPRELGAKIREFSGRNCIEQPLSTCPSARVRLLD